MMSKKIKVLVMDVDGTLTDGKINIGEHGEIMKSFSCKDGYALRTFLPQYGIIPVIITGRESKIVEARAKELGITMIYQGIGDKLTLLKHLADENQWSMDEIAYIGDDLNDWDCLKACGLTAGPSDSCREVLAYVDYVCKVKGGEGAVRDFMEWMMDEKYIYER
jgi:3-deoxy-D-manno-octulosonate 8-phosphate phosphatase (KDO 8-P phosphatase)